MVPVTWACTSTTLYAITVPMPVMTIGKSETWTLVATTGTGGGVVASGDGDLAALTCHAARPAAPIAAHSPAVTTRRCREITCRAGKVVSGGFASILGYLSECRAVFPGCRSRGGRTAARLF